MTSAVNFTQPTMAENIEIPGIRMSVILSTACSGGKLTIIEEEVGVGAGSPAHICKREDKVILVTDGIFTFYADGKTYEAGKGCNIFIPRGTKHYFKNAGTHTGKLLITYTPGGQENFFKDLSHDVKVFGNSTAVMRNVAQKYEVVLA